MCKTNFIKNPFIPEKSVSLALFDGRYREKLIPVLKSLGIDPIFVDPCPDLYPAISCHADIQCHPLGHNKIVMAPNASQSLKNQLIQHDFEIIVGNTRLKSNYPNNIAYNVARIGGFAFHNTKYTDPVLKAELLAQGVKLIHVNQGYAKCSISIVDELTLITSDMGIAKAAKDNGLKVMTISPGFINLPGLNYGFIGGATGLLSSHILGFMGRWQDHRDGKAMEDFLYERSKTPLSIGSFPLLDIGGIIPLKEV